MGVVVKEGGGTIDDDDEEVEEEEEEAEEPAACAFFMASDAASPDPPKRNGSSSSASRPLGLLGARIWPVISEMHLMVARSRLSRRASRCNISRLNTSFTWMRSVIGFTWCWEWGHGTVEMSPDKGCKQAAERFHKGH